MTMQDFIQEYGLTMTFGKPVPETKEGWAEGSRRYRIVIKTKTKRFVGPFTMGPGCKGNPEIVDVLECLASDAAAGQETFGEFCREYGYDEDSRRAKRTYDACVRTYDNLVDLLGDEAAQQLMYEIER